ncbi:unannotated protein [freshwater metagenome]|uniref:Unannotated protein n=1 Tax=freshwater metagenome TaxID=449393 RepID=A0A6J6Q1F0_9ZZZZ
MVNGVAITPAFNIKTSISSVTDFAAPFTDDKSVKSSCRTSTLPGPICFKAASPLAVLLAVIITLAFRLANSVAAAKPIPLVAPVIRNFLPDRSGRLAALQRSGIVTVFNLLSPVNN